MADEEKKRCDHCANCVLIDEGYSNYTVENTVTHCAEAKHPEMPFDRFYGEDKRLEFAEQCDSFVAGDPLDIDVDHECFDHFTPEQKALAAKVDVRPWGEQTSQPDTK